MQSIRFLKEGIKPYMLVPCDGVIIDNYRSQLLQQMKIPYFLMYEIREYNGKRVLYYLLKYRTTMKAVTEHFPLTPEKTKNILISIISALQIIDEHLLFAEHVVWKMDRIFMEVDTGHLEFCYNPMENQDNGNLEELILELMQTTADQEIVKMLSDFYNLITNPEITLEDVIQYRVDILGEEHIPPEEYRLTMGQPLIAKEHLKKSKNPDEEQLLKEYDMQRKDNVTKAAIILIIIKILAFLNVLIIGLFLFEIFSYDLLWTLFLSLGILMGTVIYYMQMEKEETIDEIMEEYLESVPDYKETTVLASDIVVEHKQKELCLVSTAEGKYPPIYIRKESILLGSMEGCDYILNQDGISRMHAKLMRKDGEVYVTDLNSTNGTMLNGKRLESGQEYKLKVGDIIAFAHQGFFVKEQ